MTLFKIGDTVEYIETGELGTVIETYLVPVEVAQLVRKG